MPSLRISAIPFMLAALFGIVSLMLVYPEQSFVSALRGIRIWWDVLFPALFPFLVISEMMLGFGMVHFFGALLDPLMRPLFRIPGIGGFVMAMGFASGYPVGARLTSQLWDQKLIEREEGERLVAFTTTSDPIFLIGAVSVGFFHDARMAVILAAAHYGGAMLVGLLMRFHGSSKGQKPPLSPDPHSADKRPFLLKAFDKMHEARQKDGRNIGELLRQAIESSLRMMIVIGGLVVVFSVILELIDKSGMMHILYAIVSSLLGWAGVNEKLAASVVNGLFEVTLGAKSAASADALLPDKTAIAAFILSWGGLSVHAQIVSITQHTTLRYRPFLLARLIHGVLSVILVYVLWTPLQAAAARFPEIALEAWNPSLSPLHLYKDIFAYSFFVFIFSIALQAVLYIIYRFIRMMSHPFARRNAR